MKTDSCIEESDVSFATSGGFHWQDLASSDVFNAWKTAKIRTVQWVFDQPPVRLDSLAGCGFVACGEILDRAAAANIAIYQIDRSAESVEDAESELADFCRTLGMSLGENHRSAGDSGVVALRTSSAPAKKGYIPYTPRPLNWHTDGYYNPASNPVKAFILHCHQQAAAGGANQVADPEIAYLRMREENPDFVRALMHPEAMTIPENREADGSLRPASVGPVFFADDRSGRLQMRYTARTRSIEWRDDPLTLQARDWLKDWLASSDPLIYSLRLKPGQGMVCNNVLHNRTGFEDGSGALGARVILRARFHERLPEGKHGTA